YMITGGNVSMLVGPDNVLLVDTGNGRVAEKVLAAVRQMTDKPIRYMVNTNSCTEHTGGNEKVATAGITITSLGESNAVFLSARGRDVAREPRKTGRAAYTEENFSGRHR